ncbi:MAG: sulfatase-like hydrolase/transferase [Kiritimatiellia bacterium]
MSAANRPNILIFMTDHQRADTVIPEGGTVAPNVSKLASEGVTFTSAYCPSPHCCPSRATFHSGLYPSRHGVWNNVCNDQALSRGLNSGIRLWSEDLAQAGYDMHWIGKWHVSVEESPKDRGWKEHLVSSASGTFHGIKWEKYRDMAAEPEPEERKDGEILRPGYGTYRLYGEAEGRGHDEKAVELAENVLRGLKTGKPWALFVGLNGPHDPYIVPEKFLKMYDIEKIPLPAGFADEMSDKPTIYQRMRETRFGQLSEREVREGVRHFRAYCSYLDELFGRVMGALEKTGAAHDTMVLYTSDHGDYCGEHGLFCKGIPCFRGAYNIPAVVRWPRVLKGCGRRVDEFVSEADFGPTFLEAAGVKAERHFTGRSLLPFLRGESPAGWRDEIHTQCNGVELYYTQRSVMTKEYKYVFNGFDQDELYDLRRDPDETRNLNDEDSHETVKRELCRRMWKLAREEADTVINPYITVGLAPYGPAEAFRK